MLNSKRKVINDILTSVKNKPKFAKLLSYSFTSLDKMVTPPESDIRINAKLIIKAKGVSVLCTIGLKNIQLCKQIAEIIRKLIFINESNRSRIGSKIC